MKTVKLGDAFKFNPPVRIARGQNVPFVSMDQLHPWTRDVAAAEVRNYSSGSKFKQGDVLMSRITPCLQNGKISRYNSREHGDVAAGSTEFIVVRGIDGVSITDFAYYSMISPRIHEKAVVSMTGTSGRQRVRLDDLLDINILLPDLVEQKKIVEVLGALDDKIAANQRVIEVSDALLHSWWSTKVADRGRPIPLSSLARFVNGKAFTKKATGEGRVVVRITELNSGITGSTVRNEIEVDPDNEVNRGDFLMAWSGSLTTARWYRDQAIVNQHIFKVIPKGDNSMWAVACAVEQQMEYFKRIAADKATTMGHIQRRHLDEKTLWVGDLTPQEEHYGRSLWKRALAAEIENEQLARTRDELLPLLMDGRITVKDAERVVEEV